MRGNRRILGSCWQDDQRLRTAVGIRPVLLIVPPQFPALDVFLRGSSRVQITFRRFLLDVSVLAHMQQCVHPAPRSKYFFGSVPNFITTSRGPSIITLMDQARRCGGVSSELYPLIGKRRSFRYVSAVNTRSDNHPQAEGRRLRKASPSSCRCARLPQASWCGGYRRLASIPP